MRKTMLVLAVLAMGTIANAGVVNYWDCDAVSGTQVIANVGPDNLAVWGTATVSTDKVWGAGSIDSPTGSFLASSFAQNTLDKGTFATWVKSTDSGNAWRGVLSTNIYAGAKQMRIEVGASPAQLYIWDIPNGTGTSFIVPTVNLSDGKWHFLVLTYDNAAGECKFYADGVLDGTATYGTANATLSGGLQLATKGKLSGSSTGLKVDETAIFDTALTSQEVEYYNSNPIPEPATMSLLVVGAVCAVIRRK